jgi:long-chain fatty acid transport protein
MCLAISGGRSFKEIFMKRMFTAVMLAFIIVVLYTAVARATNGDLLMGDGVISRSMGGVGVAAPQDAVNAVFSNPAAALGKQCFFSGTWFDPDIRTSVMGAPAEKSRMPPFLIPAIGLSHPVGDKLSFGLAFAGAAGMGADYRDNPSAGNIYTYLTIMKFAPKLAWQVTPDLSVGGSVQVAWSALDFGKGVSHGYGIGGSVGLQYRLAPVTVGLAYTTGEKVNHKRVFDLDGDGKLDALELESPRTVALGVAWEPATGLLLEGDVKFINWADAKGYKDFDWENQWDYALGAQYMIPGSGVSLRAGFNYGKNPVRTHNGWDAADQRVFSKEFLRVVGFPAIVETHVTVGAGYDFSDRFSLAIGYPHGFSKKIRETSSVASGSATLESEVAENSYEFGFTWRF